MAHRPSPAMRRSRKPSLVAGWTSPLAGSAVLARRLWSREAAAQLRALRSGVAFLGLPHMLSHRAPSAARGAVSKSAKGLVLDHVRNGGQTGSQKCCAEQRCGGNGGVHVRGEGRVGQIHTAVE